MTSPTTSMKGGGEMRLIDADAAKKALSGECDTNATGHLSRYDADAILDALPTVCCEECSYLFSRNAPCEFCTPDNLLFERREP